MDDTLVVMVVAEGIHIPSKDLVSYVGGIDHMRAYYEAFENAGIDATTDLLIFFGSTLIKKNLGGGVVNVQNGLTLYRLRAQLDTISVATILKCLKDYPDWATLVKALDDITNEINQA